MVLAGDHRRGTLFSDLESLLAGRGHGLQHLVRTDVSLEVVRVPKLTEQLSNPVDCGGGGLTLSQHHTYCHIITHSHSPRMNVWSPGGGVMWA